MKDYTSHKEEITQITKFNLVFKAMDKVCKTYKTYVDESTYIDELFHNLNAIVEVNKDLFLERSDGFPPRLKTSFYNFYNNEYKMNNSHSNIPIGWFSSYYNKTFSKDISQFIYGKGRLYSQKRTVWSFYKLKNKQSTVNLLTQLTRKGLEFCVVCVEALAGRSLNVQEIEILMSCLFDVVICPEDDTKEFILVPEGFDVKELDCFEICIDSGINRYKTHRRALVESDKMTKILRQNIKNLSLDQYDSFLKIAEKGFESKWVVSEIREYKQKLEMKLAKLVYVPYA